MSAHLNVGGQMGGYNLEENTDPEFVNSVYRIIQKFVVYLMAYFRLDTTNNLCFLCFGIF